MKNLEQRIFSIKNDNEFESLALDIFNFQSNENLVYKEFLKEIKFKKNKVKKVKDIPFLPIEFFKSKKVITGNFIEEKIFTSSGTQGNQSSHYIKKLNIYEHSFVLGFENFYGSIESYTILALLPSYMEREGSSLIYMIEKFIKMSKDKRSGFFLKNFDGLKEVLLELKKENKKVLFFGVSFGLLDFLEKYNLNLGDNFVIMDTGGMKGRKKEIIREELNLILKKGLGVKKIHSEYGMTELLSQGYLKENNKFVGNKWFKIFIRDINDPFCILENIGKTGGVNVVDLANLYSCSFVATQDLGYLNEDGSFNIIGRIDNSDVRGCNLMITSI